MPLHIIKMAAGIESLEHLAERQAAYATFDQTYGQRVGRHWTRHRPKRADEIIGSGSIYWIFKGAIQARQKIIALETLEDYLEDGVRLKKCAIVYDVDNLIVTEPQPRRPHQGWRYFADEDAPRDLPDGAGGVDPDMPLSLRSELATLGLL